MKALVTGAAGFIGSTLSESRLAHGHEVLGIDCFTPHYGRPTKVENLRGLLRNDRFKFIELDLRVGDLARRLCRQERSSIV
jgi:UDP-glucose 4-epimerase